MTIAIPNQARPNVSKEAGRRIILQDASQPNELPFLPTDTRLSLYVTPCRNTTYGDSPSDSPPPRKKRFCETNLAPGGMGKIRKLCGAPAPTVKTMVSNLARRYSGRLTRCPAAACLLPVADRRYNPGGGGMRPLKECRDADAERTDRA